MSERRDWNSAFVGAAGMCIAAFAAFLFAVVLHIGNPVAGASSSSSHSVQLSVAEGTVVGPLPEAVSSATPEPSIVVDNVAFLEGECRVRFNVQDFPDGVFDVTVALCGEDGQTLSMEDGRSMCYCVLRDVEVSGGAASVRASVPCDAKAASEGVCLMFDMGSGVDSLHVRCGEDAVTAARA